MKNFRRALKLALQYRLTFVISVLSAIGVAVFWGANFGAIYPLLDVVLEDRSGSEELASRIAKGRSELGTLDSEITSLEQQLQDASDAETASISHQLDSKAIERTKKDAEVTAYVWCEPYVEVVASTPFKTVVVALGVLFLGTLFKSMLLICSTIASERLAQRATFDLREIFYRRTLDMELASFSENDTSDLMSRFTNDMNQVTGGIRSLFGQSVREPLKMVACFAGAAYINWRLLILSLVVAPLGAVAIGWLAKAIKRANRRAMEGMAGIYGRLSETFGTIKAVKAFTMEDYEQQRFRETNHEFYRKSMKVGRYDSLTRPVTELMGIGALCVAVIAGAHLVINNVTHIGGLRLCDEPMGKTQLFMFYIFLAGVSDPARKLSGIFLQLQRGFSAADRVYETLDREPAIQDPVDPIKLDRHQQSIKFEKIHFAYNDQEPILRGVDLEIPFGKTVAIVGPNGSGKSTLTNLLPRFYDPQQGSVLIDGKNIRDARVVDVREQIGLVTQESLMFNDTVAENIRYGSPNATDEEVQAAAKKAFAHQFIEEQLEEGYQTLVGERGGRLSGGQRQRISLARAILRDPAILILDEATSQVDLEGEQLIHQVLEGFMKGRTSLVITHRRSTLDLADVIVVMDGGRIVDSGSHEDLIRRCDVYQRLFQQELRASA